MFIDTVPEESADGALAEFYRQQKSAWGFLPNFAEAFSTRPEVARAWSLLNKTVRDGMDRRRFEIATIGAAMGLPIDETVMSPSGRPFRIGDMSGHAVADLFA